MTKMKDIPSVDRPREKFLAKGPDALTESELLAILLGSGTKGLNVKKLSEQILRTHRKKFLNLTVKDLLKIPGIGKAKALQIVSAISLVKRFTDPLKQSAKIIRSTADVIDATSDLIEKKKEYLVCLHLNARNVLLKKDTVSIGTLTQSLVHPREVFAPAFALHSAGVILVHNHPSGDSNPSQADIAVVNKLVRAGRLLGINVIDFVILSQDQVYSFFNSLQSGKKHFSDYIADGVSQSLDDLLDDNESYYNTLSHLLAPEENNSYLSTPF